MKLLGAILFFIPYILFSQEELNQSGSTFDKAINASDMAWSLKDINPDSSLYYAQTALKFSIESGQKKIEAYSYSDIGNYHKRKENYKTALDNYLISLIIRKELGEPKDIAAGYNQLGILYKQQEKYDSASIYFSNGISIVKKTKFKDELLRLYDGYAMTLYHLGEAESALAYLDTAFVLAQQIEDKLTIAKSIQNKGVVNQYLGHNKLALKYYEDADEYYVSLGNINGQIEVKINQASIFLNIGKKKEAEWLLLDAEKQCLQNGFIDNLFIIYMDLGQLHKSNNIFSSKVYLLKAYENAIANNKVPAQIESGIELGMLALSNGDTNEASTKINEIKSLDVNLSKVDQFSLYLLESNYWEAVKDYKQALSYSRKSLSLKDSLHRSLNNLQDLSKLLEIERYEKGIAIEQLRTSNAEKAVIQAKLSRDRIVIWALILGGILLTLLFWGKRKRLKVEHEKKLQEDRFQIALIEKEYESDLLFLEENLILETDIRKKIGRDLHDHLGSKLAVIQITLEAIANRGLNSDKRNIHLDEAIDLVEKSCKDIRDISHDLIEHEISKDSLDKLFLQHCKSVSASDFFKIEYSLVGEAYQVSLPIKKHLYTTVILLIDNIIKHAQANTANLQLFYHNDCINVQLDDDGIGLDNDKNEGNSGFGLINAKERIKKINGTIEIDSLKNNGTFVSISVPINHG